MYNYEAKLLKVIDGDTVDLEIDLGLSIYHKIRCRLYGINAPELRDLGGIEAKVFLESLLTGKLLHINTIKDKKEKYGRYLVVIETEDISSVNAKMIDAGHSQPYTV